MCCLEGTDPTDIIAGKHVKKSKEVRRSHPKSRYTSVGALQLGGGGSRADGGDLVVQEAGVMLAGGSENWSLERGAHEVRKSA